MLLARWSCPIYDRHPATVSSVVSAVHFFSQAVAWATGAAAVPWAQGGGRTLGALAGLLAAGVCNLYVSYGIVQHAFSSSAGLYDVRQESGGGAAYRTRGAAVGRHPHPSPTAAVAVAAMRAPHLSLKALAPPASRTPPPTPTAGTVAPTATAVTAALLQCAARAAAASASARASVSRLTSSRSSTDLAAAGPSRTAPRTFTGYGMSSHASARPLLPTVGFQHGHAMALTAATTAAATAVTAAAAAVALAEHIINGDGGAPLYGGGVRASASERGQAPKASATGSQPLRRSLSLVDLVREGAGGDADGPDGAAAGGLPAAASMAAATSLSCSSLSRLDDDEFSQPPPASGLSTGGITLVPATAAAAAATAPPQRSFGLNAPGEGGATSSAAKHDRSVPAFVSSVGGARPQVRPTGTTRTSAAWHATVLHPVDGAPGSAAAAAAAAAFAANRGPGVWHVAPAVGVDADCNGGGGSGSKTLTDVPCGPVLAHMVRINRTYDSWISPSPGSGSVAASHASPCAYASPGATAWAGAGQRSPVPYGTLGGLDSVPGLDPGFEAAIAAFPLAAAGSCGSGHQALWAHVRGVPLLPHGAGAALSPVSLLAAAVAAAGAAAMAVPPGGPDAWETVSPASTLPPPAAPAVAAAAQQLRPSPAAAVGFHIIHHLQAACPVGTAVAAAASPAAAAVAGAIGQHSLAPPAPPCLPSPAAAAAAAAAAAGTSLTAAAAGQERGRGAGGSLSAVPLWREHPGHAFIYTAAVGEGEGESGGGSGGGGGFGQDSGNAAGALSRKRHVHLSSLAASGGLAAVQAGPADETSTVSRAAYDKRTGFAGLAEPHQADDADEEDRHTGRFSCRRPATAAPVGAPVAASTASHGFAGWGAAVPPAAVQPCMGPAQQAPRAEGPSSWSLLMMHDLPPNLRAVHAAITYDTSQEISREVEGSLGSVPGPGVLPSAPDVQGRAANALEATAGDTGSGPVPVTSFAASAEEEGVWTASASMCRKAPPPTAKPPPPAPSLQPAAAFAAPTAAPAVAPPPTTLMQPPPAAAFAPVTVHARTDTGMGPAPLGLAGLARARASSLGVDLLFGPDAAGANAFDPWSPDLASAGGVGRSPLRASMLGSGPNKPISVASIMTTLRLRRAESNLEGDLDSVRKSLEQLAERLPKVCGRAGLASAFGSCPGPGAGAKAGGERKRQQQRGSKKRSGAGAAVDQAELQSRMGVTAMSVAKAPAVPVTQVPSPQGLLLHQPWRAMAPALQARAVSRGGCTGPLVEAEAGVEEVPVWAGGVPSQAERSSLPEPAVPEPNHPARPRYSVSKR
ncbi:hypothetical protein HYH03_006905 [Edaphochlamys debaryana]|uniref:Uncharacterized protein n=1 Tax=Edaphochlamys debaryana TaxID=47281 RepID=A0A835Y1R9_9CHLO|nr:hypothetical protein HYH03_006905 [Edaphochlamys debaryana]|eukprot:KAG2494972.1 hypothetical protein HYH03_006905 [Edaphochlamys debaryana]